MREPTPYRPSVIIRLVTQALGVSLGACHPRRRTRYRVAARQLTCYLLRRVGIHSYSDIARILGYRYHTTARHAVKRLAARIEREPYLRDLVKSLEVQVGIGTITHRDVAREIETHTITTEPREERMP